MLVVGGFVEKESGERALRVGRMWIFEYGMGGSGGRRKGTF